MILRNPRPAHLGETVREAFELMYYLEAGLPDPDRRLRRRPGERAAHDRISAKNTAQQFARDVRPATQKDWPELLRLLDRKIFL